MEWHVNRDKEFLVIFFVAKFCRIVIKKKDHIRTVGWGMYTNIFLPWHLFQKRLCPKKIKIKKYVRLFHIAILQRKVCKILNFSEKAAPYLFPPPFLFAFLFPLNILAGSALLQIFSFHSSQTIATSVIWRQFENTHWIKVGSERFFNYESQQSSMCHRILAPMHYALSNEN